MLADDIARALPEFRAMAEARMTGTCLITRPGSGNGPFNEGTGQYDDPAPVTVYEGKCRIPRRSTGLTSGASTGGQTSWLVGEYPLDLPIDGTGDIGPGMTVNYLSDSADPDLAGRVFGITEPSRQSQATARRFKMKEVVG